MWWRFYFFVVPLFPVNLCIINSYLMKHVNLILTFWLTVCMLLTGCSTSKDGEKHNFSIGKGTFLLDGKPFVIKAAEIHYTRIPADYWEHRIQMCKALGMNTICIYAFWNIHEQKPGEFNFEGQNDIARFCRLAQKHGMYIMLRPGPYVCAEWENESEGWHIKCVKAAAVDGERIKADTWYMLKDGEFVETNAED